MFCDEHDGSVSWYVCVHGDGIRGEELCCWEVLCGVEFLAEVVNPKTKEKCNIKRMIIAYKRPMNLGNLLSHRNLATGPPVSSYLYD